VFEFSALSEVAVVPLREQEVNTRLLRDLVDRMTKTCTAEECAQQGDFFTNLMIPDDFRKLLEGPASVTLEVDATTAVYPWEMAGYNKISNAFFLGTNIAISRQFRTLLSPPPTSPPALNSKLKALIIADPAPGSWSLPGARVEGAAVVDVRPGRDYDRGHIPGSYNIGIDGPVSAWVGWLIARGRPIVLAGGTDAQHKKARRQLLRIGFDTIAGALDGGVDAWRSSGRDVSSFETVDVEDMAEWVISAEPMTVVDARDEHEWSSGHVPGALHMYVPDVPHHVNEIPHEAPVAVHCASGYRAGIAASLLEQAGLKRIIHVNGPYSDWDRLHLAESRP